MSDVGKYFFLFVLLCVMAQNSLAQSESAATDPCKTVPSDFRDMADFKGAITNEIATLEQSVKELPAKRDQTRQAETDLKDTQEKIDALKNKPSLSDDETRQLENLQTLLAQIQKYLAGNSSATYEREFDKASAI